MFISIIIQEKSPIVGVHYVVLTKVSFAQRRRGLVIEYELDQLIMVLLTASTFSPSNQCSFSWVTRYYILFYSMIEANCLKSQWNVDTSWLRVDTLITITFRCLFWGSVKYNKEVQGQRVKRHLKNTRKRFNVQVLETNIFPYSSKLTTYILPINKM